MIEEFTIHWEVDEVSKLTNKYRYSPVQYHCGLPWRIVVNAENTKRTNNVTYFSLFLECNVESDCGLWRCERTTTLSLLHWKNPEKHRQLEVDRTLKKSECSWGYSMFLLFTSLLNNSGFVKDDKIIVEARVKVKSVDFIRKRPTIDFSQDTADWDNIALKLEDGTVNVCRRFLMWHSPYFASILSPEQKENNQDQIEIADVKTKDFIELLNVIYPTQKPINVDIYMTVLSLANRFNVELALDRIEHFLMNTQNVDTAKKMKLAEQYRFDLLMKHCFNSLKTPLDVKYLEYSADFSKLSVTTKVLLFEKVLALIKTKS